MPVALGALPHDLALAVLLFEQLLFRQPLSFRLGPYALGLHGAARFSLRKSFARFGGALRLVEGELRLLSDSLHPLGVEGRRSLLPLRLLRFSRRRRLRARVLTLFRALRRNLSRASERGFRRLAIRPQLLAVGRGARLCFFRGALRRQFGRARGAVAVELLRALRVALGAAGNHDLARNPEPIRQPALLGKIPGVIERRLLQPGPAKPLG